MSESTFIGLDVHARSVVAGILEGESGEVRTCSASAHTAELVPWLRAQGESISVAYEAGPTGFGLARACAAAQIPCLVAAPSKIARAPGERVKTDRRDALRLARLLRLGELTPVRVPSPAEEGARDLVRAREDARGDLMRARAASWRAAVKASRRWCANAPWPPSGVCSAAGAASIAAASAPRWPPWPWLASSPVGAGASP
jgi:transposase